MERCLICLSDVELEDAVAAMRSGTCICVRCFARETKTERPIPAALRRELEQALTV
jgi:hypothetical protein